MRPHQLFILLLLGVVWGADFLFIKIALRDLSPLMVVEGAMLLGALGLLLVVALLRLTLPRSPGRWLDIAVMAALTNLIPLSLVAWGEQHIDSGMAAVLSSTMPLFIVVVAAFAVPEEEMTLGKIAGLAIGFVGVAVFSGGDLLDITSSSALAVIAVIGAAASWGLAAVFARVRLRDEHPLVLSASILVVSALLLAPIVGAIDRPAGLSLGLKSGLSVLAFGLMGTGLAYVGYFWLLDRVGAIKTSLVSYIIPVTGLFLGWAVLAEAVDASALVGLALIVGGIALVSGVPLLPRLRPAVSTVRREDGP